MNSASYDWVWAEPVRDLLHTLESDDEAALSLRLAFISQNPWPDWQTKHFVEPEYTRNLPGSHFIIYVDDVWAIVYEVAQPYDLVIFSFAKL